MEMNEQNFGKGAIRDAEGTFQLQHTDIGAAAAPFSWDRGFDIESILGCKIITKNQGTSYSCGGQAWAYYGEVLGKVNSSAYIQRSARFIYSQTYVPGGGSAASTNNALVSSKGWGLEADVSSYKNGEAPDEPFMEDSSDIGALDSTHALSFRLSLPVQIPEDIDTVAQYIATYNGAILGIVGQNNGTWLSSIPTPPDSANPNGMWQHWLYAGKAKMLNGKKAIGVKNSWGDSAGDSGWQWLTEDYFNTIVEGKGAVWYAMTMASVNVTEFNTDFGQGSNGPDVENLQKILAAKGLFSVVPTGFFGPITVEAVKKYQALHGIPTTGFVGPLTRAALNKGL